MAGGLLLIHVGSMVCMFDTIVSPVKMAELIEMAMGYGFQWAQGTMGMNSITGQPKNAV